MAEIADLGYAAIITAFVVAVYVAFAAGVVSFLSPISSARRAEALRLLARATGTLFPCP